MVYGYALDALYLRQKRRLQDLGGMERGDFEVVTSTVTLLEVLVHPLREENAELASEYRAF